MKTSVKLQTLFRKVQRELCNEHFFIFLMRGCGAGVFLLALFFNMYRLGVPGIWFDEAFSVGLARQPLSLLMHIIFGPEPNMELYYLLLHFWLSFCGWVGLPLVEFVVRFPSACFAAIASLVVFLLGKRFLGFGTGLLGALLFLLNIQQLTYAQQTRSYSLQLLLLCAGWYALFSALTVQRKVSIRRWWCGYTIAMLLAIYAHLFSVFILLAQVVAMIGIVLLPNAWRDDVRSRLVGFIISVSLIGMGCLFLLPAILGGDKTGWLLAPQWHDFYHLFDAISGHDLQYLLVSTFFCAVSIVLLILGWIFRYRSLSGDKHPTQVNVMMSWLPSQQVWPIIWSLCCWLILPVIVSYAISQTELRLFSGRYLVTIVPPFLLLVSIGIAKIPWCNVRVLVALFCLVLALSPALSYYANAQVEDWNTATPWIQARYQEGDGLICYDSDPLQGCQISVEYYLQAYPTGAHFTEDTPGAFSWARFGPVDPAEGFDAALDPAAIARFVSKHKRFFYIVGRVPSPQAQQRVETVEQWLKIHYHQIDQLVTQTVTVGFYTT